MKSNRNYMHAYVTQCVVISLMPLSHLNDTVNVYKASARSKMLLVRMVFKFEWK